MIPNVPKLTTAALKMSSSRISSAPSRAANSSLNTGFDARSIHSVRPLPVAMCRPATKSGIAPKLICAPWVLPETEPATVWPLPMPGGLDRPPVGVLPRDQLEVGVELGDLHAGLGEDDVAALRGRIGGIEVRLADCRSSR